MRKLLNYLAAVLILFAVTFTIEAKDFKVVDFGAKPDGVTLNTQSIQAAIDYVSEHGGGRLIFTPGIYVCGSVYLKNGVFLHFDDGATLLGSLNPWDYEKDKEAGWTSFIFGIKQDNIGITGKGTIDCRGFEVANRLVDYIHKGLIADNLILDRPKEDKRPENLHFLKCKNVTIKDITLKNPASWNQQYDSCDKILIEGIKVDAKAYWNNDGLDIVDSRNVIIRDCFIDSSDDAYCFKSHHSYGISENVLVENCIGRSSANGIKFGTYTLGTFRNFHFKNIKIYDTYRSAFTVASVDGASIENIYVDGLQSLNTGNPIFIRLARRRVGVSPCLKNIVIKNMYAEVPFDKPDLGYTYEGPIEDLPRNVCPSMILGLPDMKIQNIRMENIIIVYPGKADPDYAYRGTSKEELAAIPELEKSYPEFSNWKELPAWGFYIRHAEDVYMKNVNISVRAKDYRPAIVSDDVNGFVMKNVLIEQKSARKEKKQIITVNTKKFSRK